jgi:hypothetical protein
MALLSGKYGNYLIAIKVISILEIVVIHRVSVDLRGPLYIASVATKFTVHGITPRLGVSERAL